MLRSSILSHAKSSLHFKQLQEFESEVPWEELTEITAPFYLESAIGRLIVPTEIMLRIYFLQLRYVMSASAMEEALFKIEVLRKFARIDMDSDVIPNASYIQSFQRLVMDNNLESKLNESFNIEPMVTMEDTLNKTK